MTTINPLDVIPRQWLPDGHSERRFEAKAGFVKLMSGKAQVQRDKESISIKTPNGNFSLKPDKAHPGMVTATTPEGKFSGKVDRQDDSSYIFHTADGKKSLQIAKKSDSIRFDTHGFGALDMGHLSVFDH